MPADAESARLELDRYRAETDRLRATLDQERLALERYRAQLDLERDQRRPMFEAVIRFAEMTVRSLLILNIASVLGLLALVSNATGRFGALNLRPALIAFGAGATLAVVTAAFSYVAQSSFAVSEGTDGPHQLGQSFKYAAVISAASSLIAFFAGVGLAALALP
jgi:hypothetical protein